MSELAFKVIHSGQESSHSFMKEIRFPLDFVKGTFNCFLVVSLHCSSVDSLHSKIDIFSSI